MNISRNDPINSTKFSFREGLVTPSMVGVPMLEGTPSSGRAASRMQLFDSPGMSPIDAGDDDAVMCLSPQQEKQALRRSGTTT